MLANIPRLVSAYYTERPDPAVARAARGLRHLGTSRLVAHGELQRVAYPRHHPGHLPLPEGAGDRRTALPRERHARADSEPASAARSRCSPRTASTSMIDRDDGPRRRPPSRTPSSTTTAAHERARRRHRHHALAQPARGRRLQVQSAIDGGPADTEVTRWIEDSGQRSSSPTGSRRAAHPVRARAPRADHASLRLRRRLCRRTSATVIDMTSLRGSSLGSASIRSAAPASRTGAHRRAVRLAARRRERVVDPTFRFMSVDWDGKIRMDLLVTLRHGSGLIGAARALRSRLRLRPRRTTATASSTRSAGLLNPNHYLAVAHRVSVPAPAGLAPRTRRSGRPS